jgi:hypothetical protein
MVRFGLLSLALTTVFVLASVPAIAKDTFECEIKEQLLLTEGGIVRPDTRFVVSGRFWLDKKKPLIAGDLLPDEYPEWSVVRPGGPGDSFLMLGSPLGFARSGLSFFLQEALSGGEPSAFVYIDLYGPFQGYSGLCR